MNIRRALQLLSAFTLAGLLSACASTDSNTNASNAPAAKADSASPYQYQNPTPQPIRGQSTGGMGPGRY